MTRKQKRLAIIAGMGAVLLASVLLVMSALRDKIVFFYTPTEIVAGGRPRPGSASALAGWSRKAASSSDGENVSFIVTDTEQDLPVSYKGILPDLFREGQGVVSEGTVEPTALFVADTVLAKHDENYMPQGSGRRPEGKGRLARGDEPQDESLNSAILPLCSRLRLSLVQSVLPLLGARRGDDAR